MRDLLAARCEAIRRAPHEVPLHVAQGRLMDGIGVVLRGNATVSAQIAGRYLGLADAPALTRLAALLALASNEPGRAGFGLGVAAGANNWADTSLRSLAHPGAAVIPALLAAGRTAAWPEAATAIAAGYEAIEVVGRALNDGVPRLSSQRAGFRTAALCGAFGAVGLLAVLNGLTTQESADAFGIACDLVGGLTRQIRGPDSAIRMQAGSAVRAGFDAITLARAGVRSAPDVFEAEDGFLRAHHANPPWAPPESPQWHINDAVQKFHCAPHNYATALDLMRAVGPSEPMVRIEVRTPQEHLDLARSPSDFPDTPARAALNLRYCCARVLATGDFLWPEDLSAGLTDGPTRDMFDRIEVLGDEELSARLENDREAWPARVRITFPDGRVRELAADRPFGTDIDYQVAAAARTKFDRDAAAGGVSGRCGEAMSAAIHSGGPVLEVLFDIVRAESGVRS